MDQCINIPITILRQNYTFLEWFTGTSVFYECCQIICYSAYFKAFLAIYLTPLTVLDSFS